MRLRLTHLLFAGERRLPDAVATAADPGSRWFVPGWLACGECGPCRRGWLGACPRGRALVEPGTEPPVEVEVGERFLTAIDDPPGVAALDDARAACAGLVAELQELAARVGLGSGDVAVWIGDGARSALGARLSAGRGCATFRIGTSGPPLDEVRVQIQEQERQAPNGFLERRLFVERAEPALIDAALGLVVPGTSLGFLDGGGGAPLPLPTLASCRVVVAPGRGYHPDLVPEALAALRRDPTLTEQLLGGTEVRVVPR